MSWGKYNVYSLNELIQYMKALNTVLAYTVSVNLFSRHSIEVSCAGYDATGVQSLTLLFSGYQHVSFCFRAFLANLDAVICLSGSAHSPLMFPFEAVLLYCHLLYCSYRTQEFNFEVGRLAQALFKISLVMSSCPLD